MNSGPRRRRVGLTLAATAVCVLIGVSGAGAQGTVTASGPPHLPKGTSFYVEPDGNAARQAEQWRAEGRTADADLMAGVAAQPTAIWFTTRGGALALKAGKALLGKAADRLRASLPGGAASGERP